MSAAITTAIDEAVEELEQLFGPVEVVPDESGGAYVTVAELDLGERWSPQIVPISFQLAFNYPHAAVYPYYCPAGLQRVDGGPVPSALQTVTWRGHEMTQISLRANRWSPVHDSAAGCLGQVLQFFRTVS